MMELTKRGVGNGMNRGHYRRAGVLRLYEHCLSIVSMVYASIDACMDH